MKLHFSRLSQYKSFKVFLWAGASVLVTFMISLLAELLGAGLLPTQMVTLVPVINTILYALKQFIEDNRGQEA